MIVKIYFLIEALLSVTTEDAATASKANSMEAQRWITTIEKVLKPAGYLIVAGSSLVGLLECIAVRSQACIRHVQTASIKTGFGGLYGNKGSVMTRMLINDTSVCFLNCHLAAGHEKVQERNGDLESILKSAPFNPIRGLNHPRWFINGGDGSNVMDHEVLVLFGDLNYRVDLDRRELVEHLEGGCHHSTLPDQLKIEKQKASLNGGVTSMLPIFIEAPIKFPPTYRYDRGSDRFDTSDKQRIPAWCDRILVSRYGMRGPAHSTQSFLTISGYDSIRQMRLSDHRPIHGTVELGTKKGIQQM